MKFGILFLLLAGIPAVAADGQKNGVSVLTTDCVLPQVADGGAWTTRITLVNMDAVAASYRLWFRDDSGQPWPISLNGGQASNVWAGTIPVGGSVFLESPGTARDTSQGWAYLETSQRVSGMGVFKADLGSHDAQAVVPFVNLLDRSFYLPFENRIGYVTSMALVNGDQFENASVTLTFRNTDGTVLLVDRITLNPLQHMAFSTAQKYPGVDTRNGVIEFSVSGHGASALGLLFTNRDSFTSVHVLSK